MSMYLRTPWIKRAVQGGARPTNPVAQIIAVDDAPADSQDPVRADVVVVAQLSDREVWVYAVVTPAALHAFECDAGFGRPFSSLRGGLVNLTRYDVTAKGSLVVHAFTFAGLDGCEVMGEPVYCHAQQRSSNSNNATKLPSSGESQASGDMFDTSDNSVALVTYAAGLLADLDCSAPFTESQFESSLAQADKERHGDGAGAATTTTSTTAAAADIVPPQRLQPCGLNVEYISCIITSDQRAALHLEPEATPTTRQVPPTAMAGKKPTLESVATANSEGGLGSGAKKGHSPSSPRIVGGLSSGDDGRVEALPAGATPSLMRSSGSSTQSLLRSALKASQSSSSSSSSAAAASALGLHRVHQSGSTQDSPSRSGSVVAGDDLNASPQASRTPRRRDLPSLASPQAASPSLLSQESMEQHSPVSVSKRPRASPRNLFRQDAASSNPDSSSAFSRGAKRALITPTVSVLSHANDNNQKRARFPLAAVHATDQDTVIVAPKLHLICRDFFMRNTLTP